MRTIKMKCPNCKKTMTVIREPVSKNDGGEHQCENPNCIQMYMSEALQLVDPLRLDPEKPDPRALVKVQAFKDKSDVHAAAVKEALKFYAFVRVGFAAKNAREDMM